MSATVFSQRDARWAGAKLGTSALTLGEAGCLVTAVASLLADWGLAQDPGQLNAWLTAHDGYVDGSRFVFRSVEPLGVRLRAWVDYYRIPANLARVGKALADGWGALALVDGRPGSALQDHWVRLLAVELRDCLIMDPWQAPGQEVGSLCRRYGCPGWDAGRAIFVYVAYARIGPLRRSRNTALAARVQDQLCWREGPQC